MLLKLKSCLMQNLAGRRRAQSLLSPDYSIRCRNRSRSGRTGFRGSGYFVTGASDLQAGDNKAKKTLVTITVHIRPEVQAELARQAAASGRALEAYAATLLEKAAHVTTSDLAANELEHTDTRTCRERKSLRDVFEVVRGLADDVEFSRNRSSGRLVDLS